ncbi:MAG: hypothetical protein ACJAS4_000327 [Bacteriovoracaceae bacterium]|jgi:hypothetical protein
MKLIGTRCALSKINPSLTKLSPVTKSITPEKVATTNFLKSYIAVSLLFIFVFRTYPLLFNTIDSGTIKAYLLIPFVYVFTMYLGINIQVFSLLFKDVPIDIHNSPFLSKNLFEFWSIRWNVWIRDWLRSTGKYYFPKKLYRRQLFIFIASGLFHELMLTVPFFIATGQNLIGSMVIYFLIQFFGLIIDKQLKQSQLKKGRYLLMWVTILLPAPLFINKAFIQLFGF